MLTESSLRLLDRTFDISDAEAERLLEYCREHHPQHWDFVQFCIDRGHREMATEWLRRTGVDELKRLADVLEALFRLQDRRDAREQSPFAPYPGPTQYMPISSAKVKKAIETLDAEGVLYNEVQWWAIYRVLTMTQYSWPKSKPEFCTAIENLGLKVSTVWTYNNWRNFQSAQLMCSPEHWADIKDLSARDLDQQKVGVRLLELLAA